MELGADVGLFGALDRDEEGTVVGLQNRGALGIDIDVAILVGSGTTALGHLAVELGILHDHCETDHLELLSRVCRDLDVEGGPRERLEGFGDAVFEGLQAFLPSLELFVAHIVGLAFGELRRAASVVAAQGELLHGDGLGIADIEVDRVGAVGDIQIDALHPHEEGAMIGEEGGVPLEVRTEIDHLVVARLHRKDFAERGFQ